MNIDKKQLEKFIEASLAEDMGFGDITTESTVPEGTVIKGKFTAKAPGVLCGTEVAKAVFAYLDEGIKIEFCFKDGEEVNKGDVIAEIEGKAASILMGERLALNMMQRMSGIATRTSQAVKMAEGLSVKILDTRKTTPGLRIFEKYAVRTGGGYNHRFSLSDGVLIKDNHIKAAGSITQAVKAAREYVPHTMKIEVETESLEQVEEALFAGAEIIMLDNMDTATMKKAVQLTGGRALTEASGNMGEKDLREAASTGVDFISIGALTNSLKPLDISLKFE